MYYSVGTTDSRIYGVRGGKSGLSDLRKNGMWEKVEKWENDPNRSIVIFH